MDSILLKRGYSIEVAEEKEDIGNKIDIIGNYSKSNYLATAIVNKNGICPTVRENHGQVTGIKVIDKMGNLRIRKLTPKECFRLMGFDDADFEKAEKVNSNTQLYKQAGNSIVVSVVEYIIKALFDCKAFETEDKNQMSFNDEESFNKIIEGCKKGVNKTV